MVTDYVQQTAAIINQSTLAGFEGVMAQSAWMDWTTPPPPCGVQPQ